MSLAPSKIEDLYNRPSHLGLSVNTGAKYHPDTPVELLLGSRDCQTRQLLTPEDARKLAADLIAAADHAELQFRTHGINGTVSSVGLMRHQRTEGDLIGFALAIDHDFGNSLLLTIPLYTDVQLHAGDMVVVGMIDKDLWEIRQVTPGPRTEPPIDWAAIASKAFEFNADDEDWERDREYGQSPTPAFLQSENGSAFDPSVN